MTTRKGESRIFYALGKFEITSYHRLRGKYNFLQFYLIIPPEIVRLGFNPCHLIKFRLCLHVVLSLIAYSIVLLWLSRSTTYKPPKKLENMF